MTISSAPNDKRKVTLIGVNAIIAMQALGLVVLFYAELVTADEPRPTMVLVASGITIAIMIGLFLRNNAARLAFIFLCSVSAFFIVFEIAAVTLSMWQFLSGTALIRLILESGVSLGITIWVIYYLTRPKVRNIFASE